MALQTICLGVGDIVLIMTSSTNFALGASTWSFVPVGGHPPHLPNLIPVINQPHALLATRQPSKSTLLAHFADICSAQVSPTTWLVWANQQTAHFRGSFVLITHWEVAQRVSITNGGHCCGMLGSEKDQVHCGWGIILVSKYKKD